MKPSQSCRTLQLAADVLLALADALVECRTLSGGEARDIVRRHSGSECRA